MPETLFSRTAFCNTFDLHYAKIGLENQFLVFFRVAVLHRFYCGVKMQTWWNTSLKVKITHRFHVGLKEIPVWFHYFKHHVVLKVLYKVQHSLPQSKSRRVPSG